MRTTTTRGASLLELAVVAAILAVLTGAGVLTWQNLQDRSQDSVAEANLQSVAVAQLRYRQTRGVWATSSSQLQSIEGGVAIVSGNSGGPAQVSLTEDGQGRLVLAVRSESGACLATRISVEGAGSGGGTTVDVELPLSCSGTAAATSGLLP